MTSLTAAAPDGIDSPSGAPAAPDGPPTGIPHVGAIDGLRAVAVIGVLLYHFDVGVVRGGFLGVDVFFVISGFLITSLLVSEYSNGGSIAFRHFWWRRFRRLLPALFLTLAGTALAVRFLAPGEFARLRGDFVAAIAYVSNWYSIAQGESYFDSFARPSPLRHLWSLAIEEQYYLVWPAVVLLGSRFLSRRAFLYAMVALAVGSTILMAVLFEPGADPSRVYYGLDTRLAGLLVGSALGLWRHPLTALTPVGADRRNVAVVAGVAAVGLAAMMLFATDTAPWMYRGGFLVVAVLTAALLAAVIDGAPVLSAALASAPAQWLGRRSYAIYLVHWPIATFTRPGSDVQMSGVALFAWRTGLTLAAAELCHQLVERPLRARRHGDEPAVGGPRLGLARLGLVASVGIIAVALLVPAAASTDVRDVLGDLPDEVVLDAPTDPDATPSLPPEGDPGDVSTQDTVVPPIPAPDALKINGPPIVAVGDSVMLRSAQYLVGYLSPLSKVDAKVSRQYNDGAAIIRNLRETEYPFGAVVVHLGTNGPPSAAMIDRIVTESGPIPVMLVNVRVFKPYEEDANAVIADAVARHPNVRLIDWYSLAGGHPEWFESDLVHPNNDGVRAYVGLLTTSIVNVQLDAELGPFMTIAPTTQPPPTAPPTFPQPAPTPAPAPVPTLPPATTRPPAPTSTTLPPVTTTTAALTQG